MIFECTTLMGHAISQAHQALEYDEVPVGAVLVYKEHVVLGNHNRCKEQKSPLAHAEFLVIQKALEMSLDLSHIDLYVTLEPCWFCAGAIALSRIRRLYFGAYDPKGGAVFHNGCVLDKTFHKPEIYGGIQERPCQELLQRFFKEKRDLGRLKTTI